MKISISDLYRALASNDQPAKAVKSSPASFRSIMSDQGDSLRKESEAGDAASKSKGTDAWSPKVPKRCKSAPRLQDDKLTALLNAIELDDFDRICQLPGVTIVQSSDVPAFDKDRHQSCAVVCEQLSAQVIKIELPAALSVDEDNSLGTYYLKRELPSERIAQMNAVLSGNIGASKQADMAQAKDQRAAQFNTIEVVASALMRTLAPDDAIAKYINVDGGPYVLTPELQGFEPYCDHWVDLSTSARSDFSQRQDEMSKLYKKLARKRRRSIQESPVFKEQVAKEQQCALDKLIKEHKQSSDGLQQAKVSSQRSHSAPPLSLTSFQRSRLKMETFRESSPPPALPEGRCFLPGFSQASALTLFLRWLLEDDDVNLGNVGVKFKAKEAEINRVAHIDFAHALTPFRSDKGMNKLLEEEHILDHHRHFSLSLLRLLEWPRCQSADGIRHSGTQMDHAFDIAGVLDHYDKIDKKKAKEFRVGMLQGLIRFSALSREDIESLFVSVGIIKEDSSEFDSALLSYIVGRVEQAKILTETMDALFCSESEAKLYDCPPDRIFDFLTILRRAEEAERKVLVEPNASEEMRAKRKAEIIGQLFDELEIFRGSEMDKPVRSANIQQQAKNIVQRGCSPWDTIIIDFKGSLIANLCEQILKATNIPSQLLFSAWHIAISPCPPSQTVSSISGGLSLFQKTSSLSPSPSPSPSPPPPSPSPPPPPELTDKRWVTTGDGVVKVTFSSYRK